MVIACMRFLNHPLLSLLPILYTPSQLHPSRLTRCLSDGNPSPHTSTFRNRPPLVPATTSAFLRPPVSQSSRHVQPSPTRVSAHPISAIFPPLNITLGSVPYDHGSSVPVDLSSSQSRSWLTVPLCSNVYPYRPVDHNASPAVEPWFGFLLHRVKPTYQPHTKCRPVPHWTTAVTPAPTTTTWSPCRADCP